MFNSKKKRQEQERTDAIGKELGAWLDRVKVHRPRGAVTFTDDILDKAGPLPLPPRGRYSDDLVRRLAAIKFAALKAERYSRDALRATPPDHALHDYWVDISQWIGSHNG